MAMNAISRHWVSIALACRTFQISVACYRYNPVLSDENEENADWLERLTTNKRCWGLGLYFLYLRNVQGPASSSQAMISRSRRK
jgi:putative transposase